MNITIAALVMIIAGLFIKNEIVSRPLIIVAMLMLYKLEKDGSRRKWIEVLYLSAAILNFITLVFAIL